MVVVVKTMASSRQAVLPEDLDQVDQEALEVPEGLAAAAVVVPHPLVHSQSSAILRRQARMASPPQATPPQPFFL